ncbi:MAG: hypothetical protein A3G71_01055 [Gammaproteobacteria bacterium RIFCSPLOWO2_12_FULL_38_14]|nr:MAG: hypothetical protein A3G71_01055 [Gammaproteobacteria bacterium RIFCSPLOWO2_12_FULL_38_14]
MKSIKFSEPNSSNLQLEGRQLSHLEEATLRTIRLIAQLDHHEEFDSPHLETYRQLIVSLLETSKYTDCIRYAKQAIALFSGSLALAEIYYARADSYRETEELALADFFFKKALALCNKYQSENKEEYCRIKNKILRDHGILFLKRKNFHNAIAIFQEACNLSGLSEKLFKPHLAVMSYLGISLVKNKNFEQGMEQLKKARALWNATPDAEKNQSMDYAAHLYHTAIENYKFQKAFPEKGDLQTSKKDVKEAIAIREKLETSSVGGNYVHNRLGDTFYFLGKICKQLGEEDEAQESFSKAKEHFESLLEVEKNALWQTKIDKIDKRSHYSPRLFGTEKTSTSSSNDTSAASVRPSV